MVLVHMQVAGRNRSRNRNLKDIPGDVTTLVIRNIPAQMEQDHLANSWMPEFQIDYIQFEKTPDNGGPAYAFVNFLNNEAAVRFHERWQGRWLRGWFSPKSLNVAPSRLQGMMNNLRSLSPARLQRLAEEGALPLVVINGQRVDARRIYRGHARLEPPGQEAAQGPLPVGLVERVVPPAPRMGRSVAQK